MKGVTINEAEHISDNGSIGKVAVFIYSGDGDPEPILEYAIQQYVGDSKNYTVLCDAHLNCPWMRTVISNINGMSQIDYDTSLTLRGFLRDNAINRIIN